MNGLRMQQVEAKTGLRRTKIYGLIAKGEFPKPLKWGKASIWIETEIEAAMMEQILKRDQSALVNAMHKEEGNGR